MRHGFLLAGAVAMGLTLGGCGTDTSGPAGASTQTSSAGSTTPSTGPSATRAAVPDWPLTIRRLGGVGQYNDTVVLDRSGKLTVQTRTITGRDCLLTKAQADSLLPALMRVRVGAVSAPPPDDAPDDPGDGGTDGSTDGSGVNAGGATYEPISLTVLDGLDFSMDLSTPYLADLEAQVADLVNDVTLTHPLRTSCTDPSATSTRSATPEGSATTP